MWTGTRVELRQLPATDRAPKLSSPPPSSEPCSQHDTASAIQTLACTNPLLRPAPREISMHGRGRIAEYPGALAARLRKCPRCRPIKMRMLGTGLNTITNNTQLFATGHVATPLEDVGATACSKPRARASGPPSLSMLC
eukprot:11182266-Lingulodinium_polyedra.AAC.1